MLGLFLVRLGHFFGMRYISILYLRSKLIFFFFLLDSYSVTFLTKHSGRSGVFSSLFPGASSPAISSLMMFMWKVMKLLVSLMWSNSFAEISWTIIEAKYHSAWGRLVGAGDVQLEALARSYNNQIVCSPQPKWRRLCYGRTQELPWLKNDGMWWCVCRQALRTHLTWCAYSVKQQWSS